MPHTPIAVIFDIDGVIRDVGNSYRRALADTVEHFTQAYRPTPEDIDQLKAEGCWNNDWDASQELIRRYWATQAPDVTPALSFETIKAFFQSKYRGENFNGYIRDEPLLVNLEFFAPLTQAGIHWGFFSGATRKSAEYILTGRLGLLSPCLIAMEDAPSKPNPTGLFQALEQLNFPLQPNSTVIYVGDTVADMLTIKQAQQQADYGHWVAVGVIPPHVQDRQAYTEILLKAGAWQVLDQTLDLTPQLIYGLMTQVHLTS
ncbi:TIGR01548 family HAD-type hydrolase [Synechococcus sp. PCC 6312]|uniref:TIGR01548 family HAD-type hydrolase n=1 Tax=Synechococcus sp. (strain ATCC 27167 / PCC 6312) TaxID=195253 RepID=UPI00029F389C|nr:TIGR01548 family HAD-type hydrolase [Synechococcus sp. PCC 6312]AFY59405.1 haloacid dehalogenase superfamily protein, subfamily IA hydrolase, TIGR01548 [Synechococcus sp. PCC 6312]